jgi:fumarate hydratase subunit beta
MLELNVSELREAAPKLKCGDEILLTGIVYTARDAAHKRFFAALDEGKPLPIDIKDCVIYYCGPTPAPEGMPIGSAGPTTSVRMDKFAPKRYDMGMIATSGKGERNAEVIEAIKRNKALYLCALGGAGAICASAIKECTVAAYDELGCESVKRLRIEKMPLFVACDVHGDSIYKHFK